MLYSIAAEKSAAVGHRRTFLAENSGYPFFLQVIPLLVLCFVATSAVVTLTTLTGALRRSHMTPNGKYKSMEFANEKMSEGSEDSVRSFLLMTAHDP